MGLLTDELTTAIQISKRRLGAFVNAPRRITLARREERLRWVLDVAGLAGEKGRSSAVIQVDYG
jgi:hypothetical protein